MRIALVGPGIMSIPPTGWGAVEILIWEYYQQLTVLGHIVKIVNIPKVTQIIETLNSEDFDFIHIHYDCFYTIIANLKCSNIAITSHYPYINQPDKYSSDKYTEIFNFLKRNQTFWLFCLTSIDRKVFIDNGADPDRIFLLPNGINDKFTFNPVPEYSKSIYLGKIEDRKRQYLTVNIPNIDYYGPGHMNHPGYKGEITRDRLYTELTKYPNLILLSKGESDPLVVKEAITAGLSVVISEFSSHTIDKNLLFIDVISEDKILDTEYVSSIIDKNRKTNLDMRSQIREYGLLNYSWSNLIQKYIDNITSIVSSGRKTDEISNKDVTLCYIVGGDDHHYTNLNDSISSVLACGFSGPILVIEFGTKLSTNNKYSVIHQNPLVSKNSKTGYLYWMQKFKVIDYIKTPYGMYVDSDTLMFNNNITDLVKQIGNKIGVCQHWWIPNFQNYIDNAVSDNNIKCLLRSILSDYELSSSSSFLSAGIFLFQVNQINKQIFNEIYSKYSKFYQDMDYIPGVTDEVFLSVILNTHKSYVVINGAMNHCCMGDSCSDLKIDQNTFYGKNKYENNWQPITFIHCDRQRRDPSSNYESARKVAIISKISNLIAYG